MTQLTCALCIQLSEGDEEQEAEATHGRLCARHFGLLRTTLQDIDRWFAHVSDAQFLQTTKDRDSEYWVGSKAPVDCGVIATLDRRSRQLAPEDALSPERVLRTWAYAIVDNQYPGSTGWGWAQDLPMPRVGMTALVAVHLANLSWTVAQDSVVRYAQHMAGARRSLTRLIPGF